LLAGSMIRASTAETRAKAEDALPGGQALPRDGLEKLQLGVAMR
jgi:hypothetical protein